MVLNKEVTKYGMFNVREIGEALADLSTKIIGVPYHLEIRDCPERGFTCINNHAIHYNRMMAVIKEKNENSISLDYCFAVASGPAPGDVTGYECDGYGGYGYCAPRNLEEFSKLTIYDESKESYVFLSPNIRNIETVDFIRDFLVFVSSYRLQKGINKLSKEQLKALEEVFIETYGKKYKKHRDRRLELEKYIEEERQREAARKAREEAEKKELERILTDPDYAKRKRQIRKLSNRDLWRRGY